MSEMFGVNGVDKLIWGRRFDSWVGLKFSGYSRISGLGNLSESSKYGFEMHFECEFSPFMIQL